MNDVTHCAIGCLGRAHLFADLFEEKIDLYGLNLAKALII